MWCLKHGIGTGMGKPWRALFRRRAAFVLLLAPRPLPSLSPRVLKPFLCAPSSSAFYVRAHGRCHVGYAASLDSRSAGLTTTRGASSSCSRTTGTCRYGGQRTEPPRGALRTDHRLGHIAVCCCSGRWRSCLRSATSTAGRATCHPRKARGPWRRPTLAPAAGLGAPRCPAQVEASPPTVLPAPPP